jgi:hypothetical protein
MKDGQLQLRGKLIRSLLLLRDMLPGTLVEAKVSCGRESCHCSSGEGLHSRFQLSLLIGGKPRAIHVPAQFIERVRRQVELHKRFQEVEAKICDLNLEDFLREKEKHKKRGK